MFCLLFYFLHFVHFDKLVHSKKKRWIETEGKKKCAALLFFSHAEIRFDVGVIETFFAEMVRNAYDFRAGFFISIETDKILWLKYRCRFARRITTSVLVWAYIRWNTIWFPGNRESFNWCKPIEWSEQFIIQTVCAELNKKYSEKKPHTTTTLEKRVKRKHE